MQDKVDELVIQLKQEPGFHRLLKVMQEKYRSFGTVRGKLVIEKATAAEKEAIGGLLQQGFLGVTAICITAENLQKAIDQTPFAGVTLDHIVRKYYGNGLLSRKEEQRKSSEAEAGFFADILKEYRETKSGAWLQVVLTEKRFGWEYLHRHYREESSRLCTALKRALCAGNNLPVFAQTSRRIAFFAAEIAGDPHAFDFGRMESHILLQIIRFILQPGYREVMSTAEKMRLYHRAGIHRDDVLNNTTVWGISCVMEDGQEHDGTKGFREKYEPLILTLNLLLKTKALLTAETKKVYVFENSGVFSEAAEQFWGKDVSLICTNGQLTAASMMILEMLAGQGCEIFYAGDFDPEGLQIADQLKMRIPAIHLWHLTVRDYECSEPVNEIGLSRLKKLDGIKAEEIKSTAEAIKQKGKAGYQEALIGLYIEDIFNAGV